MSDPVANLVKERDTFTAADEVTGGGGVFKQAKGDKDGRVGLALFERRLAFAGEAEVNVALLRIGVLAEELDAGFRKFEPFLAFFHGVVEAGEGPGGAAVHPDVFAGVVDCALTVEAGEESAVLAVRGVVEPEGNDAVVELGVVAVVIGLEGWKHGLVGYSAPSWHLKRWDKTNRLSQ